MNHVFHRKRYNKRSKRKLKVEINRALLSLKSSRSCHVCVSGSVEPEEPNKRGAKQHKFKLPMQANKTTQFYSYHMMHTHYVHVHE